MLPVLSSSPRFARTREWTRLIAITGSAQVLVQAIGFVSGILIIRLLAVEEYAFYTIASTMLGMMTLLGDSGVATGVMSQSAPLWQDRIKMGTVIATGMALRRKFAFVSLLVTTPILFCLLRQQGASWLTSTILLLSIVPAFFYGLSVSLLEIAPKVHQDIAPLQKIQVLSNTIRLAASALTLLAFPFAAVAIIGSGLAQFDANRRLRKLSHQYHDVHQRESPEVRRAILVVVKRILPNTLYFAFSSQITIWLISIFGTPQAIAKVGALSRLSSVLMLISVLFSVLIVPRFARMPAENKLILPRFLQIQAILLCVCFVIVGLVYFFPSKVLFVLGEKYAGLTSEVVLMAIGSCAGLVAGSAYGLSSSRGLIAPAYIAIPYCFILQFAASLLNDLTQVSGVLMIGIVVAIGQALFSIFYFLSCVQR